MVHVREQFTVNLQLGKMVGVVLSGKVLSAEVREGLKKQVEKLKNNDPNYKAGLVIVQVGERHLKNK